jgi:hypothetical protein
MAVVSGVVERLEVAAGKVERAGAAREAAVREEVREAADLAAAENESQKGRKG